MAITKYDMYYMTEEIHAYSITSVLSHLARHTSSFFTVTSHATPATSISAKGHRMGHRAGRAPRLRRHLHPRSISSQVPSSKSWQGSQNKPRGGPIQSTQIQQISYRTRSATFMYTWRHFKKWRPQSLQQKVLSGVNPMRFKSTERQMWKHAEVEDFERHALALKETRSCPQVATWLQETKRIFQLSWGHAIS